MSRDFTPRETLAFEKYNIENHGLSLIDFKKSLTFTYKDKTELAYSPEEIALCEQYGLLGKLYEPFNKLYDSLSKIKGGLELLSAKEKELEDYVSSNIGDDNSYVIKWFNGELDTCFHYNQYNNELFLEHIIDEAKSLSYKTLEMADFQSRKELTMKYKVNQKLNVSMRTGFHNSEVVDREVVVSKIEGSMIWIKYPLKYGGFKEQFGHESDLDKLVDWYNERHKKLDDLIHLAEEKAAKQCLTPDSSFDKDLDR